MRRSEAEQALAVRPFRVVLNLLVRLENPPESLDVFRVMAFPLERQMTDDLRERDPGVFLLHILDRVVDLRHDILAHARVRGLGVHDVPIVEVSVHQRRCGGRRLRRGRRRAAAGTGSPSVLWTAAGGRDDIVAEGLDLVLKV